VSRRLSRALLVLVALLAMPLVALADAPGSGAPAPPKNAPIDKKAGDAPSEVPTKPKPPGPVDKAPAEKAPADKTPAKNKPVDKPAGSGSGTPPTHSSSPTRHA
jgi:hypothetical protein